MSRLPELWGVLNITPDSFSDGGDFVEVDKAIARAHQMVADGAVVIDVGAESTRPGATRIEAHEEIARLTPVVSQLVTSGLRVSVDTMRAQTAAAMVDLGVPIINDVSGGQADARMLTVVADAGVDYVVMHWRGHSDQMDSLARYDNVVDEVVAELDRQLDRAVSAGVNPARITVDPGLGFAKDISQNWEVCRHIERFHTWGMPVLVGASRKRFLGSVLPEGHSPQERDGVSVALSVSLAGRGVSAFRVHEPKPHREALLVWSKSTNTEE